MQYGCVPVLRAAAATDERSLALRHREEPRSPEQTGLTLAVRAAQAQAQAPAIKQSQPGPHNSRMGEFISVSASRSGARNEPQ